MPFEVGQLKLHSSKLFNLNFNSKSTFCFKNHKVSIGKNFAQVKSAVLAGMFRCQQQSNYGKWGFLWAHLLGQEIKIIKPQLDFSCSSLDGRSYTY